MYYDHEKAIKEAERLHYENLQLKKQISKQERTIYGLRQAVNKWKHKAQKKNTTKEDAKVIEFMKRLEYHKKELGFIWRVYISFQKKGISIEDIEVIEQEVLAGLEKGQELIEIRTNYRGIIYKIAYWDYPEDSISQIL